MSSPTGTRTKEFSPFVRGYNNNQRETRLILQTRQRGQGLMEAPKGKLNPQAGFLTLASSSGVSSHNSYCLCPGVGVPPGSL